MRIGTIEPPEPRDLTPISQDQLVRMLAHLNLEDMSPEAKRAIEKEWATRCLMPRSASR